MKSNSRGRLIFISFANHIKLDKRYVDSSQVEIGEITLPELWEDHLHSSDEEVAGPDIHEAVSLDVLVLDLHGHRLPTVKDGLVDLDQSNELFGENNIPPSLPELNSLSPEALDQS